MKELLAKKRLTKELLMEIKTSFFIHPSKPADEDSYYFNYSHTCDGEVLYLFTSYDEYLKCFKDEDDLRAEFLYFNDLEPALYTKMLGVIINPASDNFLIPVWVAFHIIEDINENNKIFGGNWDEPRVFGDNKLLLDYCRGKKSFKMISNLFNYLSISTLYTPIISKENLDNYFKGDELKISDFDVSFYKEDSYYLLYTDLDLLERDLRGKEGFYYYFIADAVCLSKKSFEYDKNGIILKTPEGDFKIPRKALIKHYEKIIENYEKRKNPHEYAFKIGDDFNV